MNHNGNEEVIKVFNPKDMPFGLLSNNYEFPIYIKNVEWKTVSHYVYANMLKTFAYKTVVKNSSIAELRKIYDEYYILEIANIQKNAVQKAYEEKLKNPKISDALLATGQGKIV